MKLLLTDNIYAQIFSFLIPDISKEDISFAPSASISRELESGKCDVALIPSMDLLSYPGFFVSGKTAVSFDGSVSNSYFYFLKQIRKVREVYLRGDISKNEAILTKIIFAEQFDLNVEIYIDSHPFSINSKNYLVCGNENFNNDIFEAGLSFSDQVADMLDAPYVNYVLAAQDESVVKDFAAHLENLDKVFEDSFESIAAKINAPAGAIDNLRQNLNSVYFDMTDIEKKSLTDMVRLPYFTGLVENIEEIKFVD